MQRPAKGPALMVRPRPHRIQAGAISHCPTTIYSRNTTGRVTAGGVILGPQKTHNASATTRIRTNIPAATPPAMIIHGAMANGLVVSLVAFGEPGVELMAAATVVCGPLAALA